MSFGLEIYDSAEKPIFAIGRKYYKELGSYTVPALSHRVPSGTGLNWFNADFRYEKKVPSVLGGTLWARSIGSHPVAALDIENDTIVCYPSVDICSRGVCYTKPVKILWGVYQ